MIYSGLPFLGFGFLDNFLMIIAGSYIELGIGMVFTISTMAGKIDTMPQVFLTTLRGIDWSNQIYCVPTVFAMRIKKRDFLLSFMCAQRLPWATQCRTSRVLGENCALSPLSLPHSLWTFFIHSSAGYVEHLARKLGSGPPPLTAKQLDMRSTRWRMSLVRFDFFLTFQMINSITRLFENYCVFIIPSRNFPKISFGRHDPLSCNQSINWTINRCILKPSINQSINRWVLKQSVIQVINQSINWCTSVKLNFGHSIKQSTTCFLA